MSTGGIGHNLPREAGSVRWAVTNVTRFRSKGVRNPCLSCPIRRPSCGGRRRAVAIAEDRIADLGVSVQGGRCRAWELAPRGEQFPRCRGDRGRSRSVDHGADDEPILTPQPDRRSAGRTPHWHHDRWGSWAHRRQWLVGLVAPTGGFSQDDERVPKSGYPFCLAGLRRGGHTVTGFPGRRRRNGCSGRHHHRVHRRRAWR